MADEKKVQADEVGKDQVKAEKVQKDETVDMQFPSLEGDKATEVSKRNVDGTSGTKYTKKYVVLLAAEAKGNVQDYQHDANIKETREFILHAGLRSTGDVVFVGAEDHPDGVSTVLTYEGPVTPAVVGGKAGKEENVVLAQQIRKNDSKDAK